MKHTAKIILLLLLIFIATQLVGLFIIDQYIDIKTTAETGETTLFNDLYNTVNVAPPEIENESTSFIYILIAVLVGTGLLLLIIKFRKRKLWKVWFFLSVVLCLMLGLTPFIYKLLTTLLATMPLDIIQTYSYYITLVTAIILAFFKIIKRNIYVHNFTELFIYGGLAALIVPIIDLMSVTILLILISLYDAYAVWKSKHMVSMAKFQSQEKIFAGLLIPYKEKSRNEKKQKKTAATKKRTAVKVTKNVANQEKSKSRIALLGGGDLAFPLLFSGVILKTTMSFTSAIIISLSAAGALYLLLTYGKKDQFYPAMPFISAGCFIGYGLTFLL